MNPNLTPTAPARLPRAATPRVQALDVVRGLVMVIMALDHTRDFWSPFPVRPEDVAHAPALLFLTRWVTHFCAPTFVFLSGCSVYLYEQKRQDGAAVSRFLLTRGLWLIFMEVVLLTFVLSWSHDLILLLVIYVIGAGMVLLAGLRWLPRWALVGLTVAIVFGHNLIPNIAPVTPANAGWALLCNGPFVLPMLGKPALVGYSLGPWLGVLLAGYLLGPWFRLPLAQRNRRLRWVGAGLLALFLVLRATNWYGDPQPWSAQPQGPLHTALSFLNVTKSPPSLLFVSLTLGVALLLLSWAETATGRLVQVLRTFGQVPFFYYIGHFALLSFAAWVWTTVAFGHAVNLAFADVKAWPAGYVPSLGRAYLVWAAVVLLMYGPCRRYQRFKQNHTYWWLSYL
ncbi:heparan-alpha-glucosaminide N-acetyltransferase domain-containing protein [Hymenobacter sp. M29]|uniref:Heparan-alpha-glucosaminide N-acetyltransferase domain-containing protein n=1 Tax=Hymenobacter mellowenesis TaxID=3063995 RepID=A0ABT9AHU9_9BACT|nr:heparan-alpha-glucosaminide N-acetyltransferase domain-containing protein [Hymenobacter sp. M29]MDO7849443.1 heparan-alpha-glucosaminide N-acetyltransferase domain-containing protein [Hymenobacter sp. M29]